MGEKINLFPDHSSGRVKKTLLCLYRRNVNIFQAMACCLTHLLAKGTIYMQESQQRLCTCPSFFHKISLVQKVIDTINNGKTFTHVYLSISDIYLPVCLSLYFYLKMNTHTNIHTHSSKNENTYTHIYIYIYICIYTYINIYNFVCVYVRAPIQIDR